MAFEVTAGRGRICKNTIGGIKNAYLAPYKKVFRNEIEYDGVSVTEFPQTFIYKFELTSATDVFSQEGTESEGGKHYNQNISLTFNKLSAFDNLQFQKLMRKDYFIVVEDHNMNFFLLGFRNGLTADKLDSGITQQYKIDFTGQEEELAPFCESLIGTDLIIFDGWVKEFQDGDDFLFEHIDNDINYIFM